jgi:hypothetical protein
MVKNRTSPVVGVWTAGLLLALLAGCFPATNLKTGKVTPPGRMAFGVGATKIGDEAALSMLDIRAGLLPRWDAGMRYDFLCYVLDTRIQVLTEELNMVDAAIELGVGAGPGVLPHPLYYGGVTISKTFDRYTPYVHFRYIDIAMLSDDFETEEGDRDPVSYALFYLPEALDDITQISFGMEFEIVPQFTIIPEVLVCADLEDAAGHPLMFYNLGIRFRFW